MKDFLQLLVSFAATTFRHRGSLEVQGSRAAATTGGAPAEGNRPRTPASRPHSLVLAFSGLATLAGRAGHREARHGHRVAGETVSGRRGQRSQIPRAAAMTPTSITRQPAPPSPSDERMAPNTKTTMAIR